MTYNVYVPEPGSYPAKIIRPGSAIVGAPGQVGRVLVYFEGNIYGACNAHQFEERLLIASGRLHDRYPTVARMMCGPSELYQIGTYNYEDRQFFCSDSARFQAWRESYVAPGSEQIAEIEQAARHAQAQE